MVNITIHNRDYHAIIKIRYPLLAISFILLVFLVPYSIDLAPNYTHYRSIDNSGDYGHSMLANHLATSYQISREHRSTEEIEIDTASNRKLMIIIAPESSFSGNELAHLENFVNNGGHVLLIGSNRFAADLASALGIYLYYGETNQLYDLENNGGRAAYPAIYFQNQKYYGVTPTSISAYYYSDGENVISTASTATQKGCLANSWDCEDRFPVGIIESNDYYEYSPISLLADNWLFSNYFLTLFPENKELISAIVGDIDEIDEIIFDESHYQYAPVNREGVENMAYRLNNSGVLVVILLMITIIIPLLISYRGGLLSNISSMFRSNSPGYRLAARLENLHLQNIPVAPLSLEERFLIEHKLEMDRRERGYFQLIAVEMINYIEKGELHPFMTPRYYKYLELMKNEVLRGNECWNIILMLNDDIQKAEKLKEEAKLTGELL